MELDLDFLAPGLSVIRGRDLTAAEVSAQPSSAVGRSGRIRDRHHSLARECAQGLKTDKQIAIEHGFTPATLVRMRKNPDFIELVEHYRRDNDAAARSTLDRLRSLQNEVLDELEARLEDNPEEFKVKELTEIAALGLDRTGHGPSNNTNVNVNVGFADKLQAATQRVSQHRTLELSATRVEDAAE